MGRIALQKRNTLARNITPSFSGLVRFGDYESDRAKIAKYAAMIASGTRSTDIYERLAEREIIHSLPNTVDWKVLYLTDPAFTSWAYGKINVVQLDPEYAPTILDFFKRRGITLESNTQVTVNLPDTGTFPAIPLTTNTEHQNAVVAAQIEARRLESMAVRKQAEDKAEANKIAAEDKAAEAAEIANAKAQALEATTPPPKSNPIPLLIAAGVAFLVLKG